MTFFCLLLWQMATQVVADLLLVAATAAAVRACLACINTLKKPAAELYKKLTLENAEKWYDSASDVKRMMAWLFVYGSVFVLVFAAFWFAANWVCSWFGITAMQAVTHFFSYFFPALAITLGVLMGYSLCTYSITPFHLFGVQVTVHNHQ